MQDEVANLLWEQSWEVFGESLSKVLSEAFASYKRSAGYDEMQRLYPSAVGDEAFQVLRQALIQQWPKGNGESSHAYVELRGLQSLHSCLHAEAKQLLLARIVMKSSVTGGE